MGSNTATLGELQAAIRRIERGGVAFDKAVVTSGYAPFDRHLPGGGLIRAACHEIGGVAASGLAAGLAGRALMAGGQLFWCQSDAGIRHHGGLYGPGLAHYGISPERCLHIRAPDDKALLWAVEEIARSKATACVVAETNKLDLLNSRRLQLAAEAGGGIVLLVRTGPRDLQPLAAATRMEATPCIIAGQAVWRVELWRAKGAAPGVWNFIWQKGDGDALSLTPTPGFFTSPIATEQPAAKRSLAS